MATKKRKLTRDDYMHGYCHVWALENYKRGDRFFVITDVDWEDGESVVLVHCGLYRGGTRIDASGSHASLEDALAEFDYGPEMEETVESRRSFIGTLKDLGIRAD